MTNMSTLRPGLLVSLKTSVNGNVSYKKVDLDNQQTDDGKAVVKWETERTIVDPAEFKRAQEVRGKAKNMIRGICALSAFGLLCPESAKPELDDAVAAARKLTEDFNATAAVTRVHIYVIAGKVASDDVEAVKAINSEVRELLADMERGVQQMDPDVIRKAATQAKSMGSMLSPEVEARVKIAIDAARGAATRIVKAGEVAGGEIDKAAIRKIKDARTAFLDIDAPEGDAEPATPKLRDFSAPTVEPRSLEMYADDMPAAAPKAKGRKVEVE